MTRFALTAEEYRTLHHVRIRRTWKTYTAWGASFAALLAGVAIGQYAFALVWAVILVGVYVGFERFGPRLDAFRITRPFALGPFDLELRSDSYTVRVGATTLELHLNEFGAAHDWGEYFRLDHDSGCSLYIPKHQLTAEELAIVESYRQRYPGYPEKRLPW